ncbi:MAG: hypothetical protein LBI45_05320 [Bacteroidales bacterium]|jgi:hypothetical protein|nr:hypothetical protein [Bacteroidales bacterium]
MGKKCKNRGCAYHACMSDDCQYIVMAFRGYTEWKRECEKETIEEKRNYRLTEFLKK